MTCMWALELGKLAVYFAGNAIEGGFKCVVFVHTASKVAQYGLFVSSHSPLLL